MSYLKAFFSKSTFIKCCGSILINSVYLIIFLFSMVPLVKVLVLQLPSQSIDADLTPAVFHFVQGMLAVDAIRLDARTVGAEIIDKLIMNTPIKFIQAGEYSKKGEITPVCLYNRLTGELVPTDKKLFNLTPRPLTSIDLKVDDMDEIRRIIAGRHKAEHFRFMFSISSELDYGVARDFAMDCRALTWSNEYRLSHPLYDIIVEPKANEWLPLTERREIQLNIKSFEAMPILKYISYQTNESSAAFYHAIFSTEFFNDWNGEKPIDFKQYFDTSNLQKIQFNTPNLLGHYVKQLKAMAQSKPDDVYGFVEVISAVVDDEHIAGNFPFGYLLNTKVRLLLLKGIDQAPYWSKDFTVEPNTKCYEAFGQRQPENEKAICLSTPTRSEEPHYFTWAYPSGRYDVILSLCHFVILLFCHLFLYLVRFFYHSKFRIRFIYAVSQPSKPLIYQLR